MNFDIIKDTLYITSSLIIIIRASYWFFLKTTKTDSLFLYESQVRTKNGLQIFRKTEDEHLIELKKENVTLKHELETYKKTHGPLSKKERLVFATYFIILFPLVILILSRLKKDQK